MVERYNIVRERKSAYEYHHNYSLDIRSLCDVYAFNMPINDRENNAQEYRFGFNGMEKDPEITGQEGSHYTAPFWQYDTRIARRWNVDPVDKPWESSYLAFSGNPVLFSDPNGDNADWYKDIKGKMRYNENLTSENASEILEEGEEYIGKSYLDLDSKSGTFRHYLEYGGTTSGFYTKTAEVASFSKESEYKIHASPSYRRELLASDLPENLERQVFYSHIYGAQTEFLTSKYTCIAYGLIAAPFALEFAASSFGITNIWSSLGYAGQDALVQLAYNDWDYREVNLTSVLMSGIAKNQYAGGALGSIGEYNLNDGFTLKDKTLTQITTETAFSIASGKLTKAGENYLDLGTSWKSGFMTPLLLHQPKLMSQSLTDLINSKTNEKK